MIYMIHPIQRRFYILSLELDLFNTWCIHKIYGGLGNKHRQELIQSFESESAASKALQICEHKRRQRGYIYANLISSTIFTLCPQTIQDVSGATYG
ncbi:WGR domain-containing protein [Aquella oligotrophica]|uniref:WGR domain-containing protein n=1 Tax=Aquella oligotrophica TaxID=2067065 RepID=A0A2I7N6H4_9NEIS|nr:WGR domain-containing protein [Aquella oligotrophica]AUR52076.1 hypothetical protein CUN60_07105 [Aquella oligotrophica]